MYRLRMGLCLLLGAALLAGCSDRNALTAPSARPLAGTAALVDRPYTWSFRCNGDGLILADWSWMENGTVLASSRLIASEVVSSVARGCVPPPRTDSRPPWGMTLRVGRSTPPAPSRRVCRALLEET